MFPSIALAQNDMNAGLVAAPESLDFGMVEAGGAAALSFTLTNASTAAAPLSAPTTNNPVFVISVGDGNLPAQLAPGASVSIGVLFAPSAAGKTAGHVYVDGQPVVSLVGVGTPALVRGPSGVCTIAHPRSWWPGPALLLVLVSLALLARPRLTG